MRDVLEEYAEAVRPPGMALVTLEDGAGRTDVFGHDGSGRSVDEDTRFRTTSLTKAFTALAVMQQVDAGRLSLDDHVADVRPELEMDDDRYRSITIRHLLTDQAGIPRLAGEQLARPARPARRAETPGRDQPGAPAAARPARSGRSPRAERAAHQRPVVANRAVAAVLERCQPSLAAPVQRLAVRWEHRADIHDGLLKLACCLICWRSLERSS